MSEYFLFVESDGTYIILSREGYWDELRRHPDLPVFQDEKMANLMLDALKKQEN